MQTIDFLSILELLLDDVYGKSPMPLTTLDRRNLLGQAIECLEGRDGEIEVVARQRLRHCLDCLSGLVFEPSATYARVLRSTGELMGVRTPQKAVSISGV